MRTVTAVTALTLLIEGSPLVAQQSRNGALEGKIAQWIVSRSVQAAQVSLVHLESDTPTTVTAAVDASGRYRLDSLPAGRYLVQLSHPTLDSLDVTLPPGQLKIAPGKPSRSDFSLPSGERLRAMVCPGVSLGPEKAVIAGRVIDADTEAPIWSGFLARWSGMVRFREEPRPRQNGHLPADPSELVRLVRFSNHRTRVRREWGPRRSRCCPRVQEEAL